MTIREHLIEIIAEGVYRASKRLCDEQRAMVEKAIADAFQERAGRALRAIDKAGLS